MRLKRHVKGEEKLSDWRWDDDVFTGTRELNGLGVMMALINNWDLKDVNNAVYELHNRRIYELSDLGACLKAYLDSRFIHDVKAETVDFDTPGSPNLIHIVELPEYVKRMEMRSIGKKIPIADARWIGHILSKLSDRQIASAFTAAGYSPEETRAFATVVEQRIDALNRL